GGGELGGVGALAAHPGCCPGAGRALPARWPRGGVQPPARRLRRPTRPQRARRSRDGRDRRGDRGGLVSDGALLRTERLTCDFGALRAVNRVSLDVKAGTLHSVLGPTRPAQTPP